MISVVIPTCNRAALTLRAADSVLKQTVQDLELIIVDDGSEDDTAERVAAIGDPRVRYVRHEKRQGACAARNTGVRYAGGEWIAFQDSDDVWHPDKLERQMAFLAAEQADVVFCGFRRCRPDGTPESVFPPENVPSGTVRPEDLLPENLASTQTVLGRAGVFRALPFDTAFPRLQDWEMMLRAAGQYHAAYQAEQLVDVYLQPDSISRQSMKGLEARRMLQEKYLSLIAADPARFCAWLEGLMVACREGGIRPAADAFALLKKVRDPMLRLRGFIRYLRVLRHL